MGTFGNAVLHYVGGTSDFLVLNLVVQIVIHKFESAHKKSKLKWLSSVSSV